MPPALGWPQCRGVWRGRAAVHGQALSAAQGWPLATVASAVSLMYWVAALRGRSVRAKSVGQLGGPTGWVKSVGNMPVRKVAPTVMLLQAGALRALAMGSGQAAMAVATLAWGFAVGYVTTLAPVMPIADLPQGRLLGHCGV